MAAWTDRDIEITQAFIHLAHEHFGEFYQVILHEEGRFSVHTMPDYENRGREIQRLNQENESIKRQLRGIKDALRRFHAETRRIVGEEGG